MLIKFHWHRPVHYLLLLGTVLFGVGLIAYIIVAHFANRSASTYITLCPKHERRRRRSFRFTVASFVVGFILVTAGSITTSTTLHVLGMVVWLGGLGWWIFAGRLPRPTRIDGHYVWLKGVGKRFLDSLPQLPASHDSPSPNRTV
jgi:hypothetical protein